MPAFSFDLNLGSLFSPLLLMALAYVANGVKKRILDHFDAKHEENTIRLQRIEVQTTATNGRVNGHDSELASLKNDVATLKGEMTAVLVVLRKGESQP